MIARAVMDDSVIQISWLDGSDYVSFGRLVKEADPRRAPKRSWK
jgi:hypothetical protein